MDLDVFVAEHRHEWERLDELARRANRPRRLTGAEVDELVTLYQRVATQLSVVRSRFPDPALVARLSSLVARGRTAVTGASAPAWRDVARFLRVTFPTAVYRSGSWVLGAGALFCVVAVGLGTWIATTPEVQAQLLPPAQVRQLVEQDFADYYSAHSATSFAAQVWTNNALVAAVALVTGVLLGLPTLFVLVLNAANVGVIGGFMIAGDRATLFFGLLAPHGPLELSAVFVAAGVGLRLGWTVIDPGRRRRVDALAAEGRAAVTVALGLVGVLAVSGLIEAFVTPSGLPTWARVGIGVVAEIAFLAYVFVFGGRAARAGETGDLAIGLRADERPVAG